VLSQLLELREALSTARHAAFECIWRARDLWRRMCRDRMLQQRFMQQKCLVAISRTTFERVFGWLERQLVGSIVAMHRLTIIRVTGVRVVCKLLRKYVVDGRWRLDTASLR